MAAPLVLAQLLEREALEEVAPPQPQSAEVTEATMAALAELLLAPLALAA